MLHADLENIVCCLQRLTLTRPICQEKLLSEHEVLENN